MKGYKTFAELSAEQKRELKERYLVERNEANGEGTSLGEIAWADEAVSDKELKAVYGGTMFTDEDFFCSCNDWAA